MADDETLIDYEDDENEAIDNEKAKESKKGHYVGIHSTGFRDFLLKPELLHAISDCGFEHPSEVQHECIPTAMLGGDILCQAKSGMGKTAVFVLTTLHSLKAQDNVISILVIAHTRELAFQISKEYERFSKYLTGITTKVVYGGIPITQDAADFKKKCPNILVGTPGRLKALLRDKIISLAQIKFFIIDECDKVLQAIDMRGDVQQIFSFTPHDKQVMMFSATLEKDIRLVCKKFMQEPSEVYVDDETKLTLHGLLQYNVKLAENEKISKLIALLDILEFNQVVIFVRTVERAKQLNKVLADGQFPSIAIHSQMEMSERLSNYQEFKQFKKRILVATDVFARGMDVEKVNIVFNFDFPESSDTYLHRVGRAGRFGTKGLAISFSSSEEDVKIYEEVQARFAVKIDEIPETIDVSKYMNAES